MKKDRKEDKQGTLKLQLALALSASYICWILNYKQDAISNSSAFLGPNMLGSM